MREAIETADEAGDAGTTDIFTAFLRDLDKDLWFLKSHLRVVSPAESARNRRLKILLRAPLARNLES